MKIQDSRILKSKPSRFSASAIPRFLSTPCGLFLPTGRKAQETNRVGDNPQTPKPPTPEEALLITQSITLVWQYHISQ